MKQNKHIPNWVFNIYVDSICRAVWYIVSEKESKGEEEGIVCQTVAEYLEWT